MWAVSTHWGRFAPVWQVRATMTERLVLRSAERTHCKLLAADTDLPRAWAYVPARLDFRPTSSLAPKFESRTMLCRSERRLRGMSRTEGRAMKTFAGCSAVAASMLFAPAAANASERLTGRSLGGCGPALRAVELARGRHQRLKAGPQIACKIGAKRCYQPRVLPSRPAPRSGVAWATSIKPRPSPASR